MDLSFLQNLNGIHSYKLPSANQQVSVIESMFSSFLNEQIDLFQKNSTESHKIGLFLDPNVYKQMNELQASALSSYTPMTFPAINSGSSQLPDRESRFQPFIQSAAQKYNLDPKLIHSVIKHESNFNPNAKSHAGATGLMQLMPRTARMLNVQNMYDPQQNIDGGAKYLRQMMDRYNDDVKLALAAYNAGPGNVDRHGGIPPFKETQSYVPRVYNDYMSI